MPIFIIDLRAFSCVKKKNQYDDPPGAEYPPGAELCFKLGPIPQAFL